MTHGSLFSGIGGFDLAAEWSGFTNLFNCEWEEFPRKVLKHHFPNAEQYADIHDFDATIYNGRVDILSGGFPCQPFSLAGQRKGSEDERYLWKEMLRVIGECNPRWVLGENVRGLCSWSNGLVFEEVCADLEAIGYSVQSFIIPACATNAPHRRDRVWIVAYAADTNCIRGGEDVRGANGEPNKCNEISENGNASNSDDKLSKRRNGERKVGWNQQTKRIESFIQPRKWQEFPTVAPICGGDDGLPKELDGITFPKWRRESIKAYGNAIVPQVAYRIFQSIKNYENDTN